MGLQRFLPALFLHPFHCKGFWLLRICFSNTSCQSVELFTSGSAGTTLCPHSQPSPVGPGLGLAITPQILRTALPEEHQTPRFFSPRAGVRFPERGFEAGLRCRPPPGPALQRVAPTSAAPWRAPAHYTSQHASRGNALPRGLIGRGWRLSPPHHAGRFSDWRTRSECRFLIGGPALPLKFEILWWRRRGRCSAVVAEAGEFCVCRVPLHRLGRAPCGIAPGPRRQVRVLWGGPGGAGEGVGPVVYGAAGCAAELGCGGVLAPGL